jgi:hypothetical protein
MSAKWSTGAVETATEFMGPLAAFVAGVVFGALIAVAVGASTFPEACSTWCEKAEPVLNVTQSARQQIVLQ